MDAPADRPSQRSFVRADIDRITQLYEAADFRAHTAATIENREVAEGERRAANGDFWAAGEELADLFLLMLRFAMQHRPEVIRQCLAGCTEARR